MSSGSRKRQRSGSAGDEAAAAPHAPLGRAPASSLFQSASQFDRDRRREAHEHDDDSDELEEEEPATEEDDDYTFSAGIRPDSIPPQRRDPEGNEAPDAEEEQPDTEDDEPDLPPAALLPRRTSVIDLTEFIVDSPPPTTSPSVLFSAQSTYITSAFSNPTPLPTAPAPSPSLATLSCPICLGPPTPLALTSCGHAYCAPCLHAALLAGGPLTPPPSSAGMRGGGYTRARAGGARGHPTIFGPGASRGRGAGGRGGAANGGIGGRVQDEEEPSELDGHCPVCRTVLKGGWGRSIRGLTMRMLPVPTEELTLDD